jgi:hypothetical protein
MNAAAGSTRGVSWCFLENVILRHLIRLSMAQIFQPGVSLTLKLLFIALLIVIAAILFFGWNALSTPGMNAPVSQPIAFSHRHHAGDDGIDCRYCHTSVETSSFAGLPSTQICLTCHSQLFRDSVMLRPLHESARNGIPIAWNRLHDLPDFVYFDHSIHISKGVACVSCHGRVDQMPLTWRTQSLEMQWCLGCHRDPQPALRPQNKVFDMGGNNPASAADQRLLSKMYRLQSPERMTDCSTCHR